MKVVITGVSRGLGRALAARLAGQGAEIWGCARQAAPLESLQQQLGPTHHFAQVDVANDAQVATWSQAVLASGTAPDLVINNAAVMNHPAPLWEVPPDEFSRLIDVNIKGIYHVVRHFVPSMRRRGTGVLINLSSGWGRSTSPQVAPYCASKFAVEGLTKSLALELPAEITTVALNPGIINTDMLKMCWADDANQYPLPEAWAEKAVRWIHQISPADHGKSVSL